MAFTKLLPPDFAAHVSLHMGLPEYQNFLELRKLTDKYVKVMTSLDRHRKGVRSQVPVRLVDNLNSDGEFDGLAIDDAEFEDDGDFICPALDGLDVEQRVEVLAFMKARVSSRQGAAQEAGSNDGLEDEVSPCWRMALPGSCHRGGAQI